MIKSTIAFLGLLLIAQPALAQKPTRDQKVRADKAEVEAKGFWLYNDLDKAYQLARQSGKPILVALRCIPCEECVKLDDDLVDNDPIIRPLLEQFVCVRIVGTNGLDLNTFQYDTDQSFALFMLNADKTIYGRFGTRSHRTDWMGDVSLDGMARALDGALALHKQYPDNRSLLAGKTGKPLEFDTPEKFPALSEKYTDRLNYSGDVVKSCIHCHQIGDARRDYYWEQSQPIPEPILFPYPHPKAVGMILDPNQRATVKDITAGTPAAASGLQPGDEIVLMNGQPLLSMADVQWILHHVPAEGGEIALRVRRDDEV
ncbi:MAG: thioredoxin family protein, partial [Planctomycetales bacterium]|nr:thioredoxin family protein [Planctomycetales bacterium]